MVLLSVTEMAELNDLADIYFLQVEAKALVFKREID